MFKKLFGEAGVKNAVTIFHSPTNPASTRILSILQKSAGPAAGTSAADKSKDDAKITLDVTTEPPTSDQLRTIMEFLGASKAGEVIEGASDEADAQRRLRGNAAVLKRPLVVDWNAGKVVVGDKEKEVESLVKGQ